MKFKFQERRCDVERDNRLASFRNRGFCDVAKDIVYLIINNLNKLSFLKLRRI